MAKIGDRVRLKMLPPAVERLQDEDDDLHTKGVVLECLGRTFLVRGIGTNNTTDHMALWVKNGVDENNIAEADVIWVESQYVETVTIKDDYACVLTRNQYAGGDADSLLNISDAPLDQSDC
jgi:hypothetical protein